MVCSGAKTKEDLWRVNRAILALLDQTVVLLGLSSSAEEGRGRSPYNPKTKKKEMRERERERVFRGYE